MFTIIPLEDTNGINNTDFSDSMCHVIGLNTIAKFIAYDKYPLKNKTIAIKNILDFLMEVDSIVRYKKTTVITIHTDIIIKHFSANYYKAYMDVLKELRIINKVPYADGSFYEKGEYAQQYQLYSDYTNDELCIVLAQQYKGTKIVTDKQTYNKKLVKTISNVEIDYTGAINAEIKYYKDNGKTLNSLRVRLNTLFRLNHSRFLYTGFKVDRVYHSLTNISRISRKFLTINGEEFNDVDVKNCQPLLLCYLLFSKGLEVDANYKHDCEIGNLYENFITVDKDRSQTKVEMYKNIYFAFKPNSDIAQAFKKLYPKTFASLEILSNEPEEMACMLQNIEAEIFNGIVPNKSKDYYTLFDSVYFTDIEDCVQIIKEIKDRFNKYKIRPIMTINGETENDTDDRNLEDEVYVITKLDYMTHLNNILDYSTISHKIFRTKYDDIIDALVNSQARKKKDIIDIIKNIVDKYQKTMLIIKKQE